MAFLQPHAEDVGPLDSAAMAELQQLAPPAMEEWPWLRRVLVDAAVIFPCWSMPSTHEQVCYLLQLVALKVGVCCIFYD